MLRLFMDDAVHRQDLDEAFKQQLNSQRDNLFRMDRLVKTLLDLSALELRDTIEKQDFNLTALIEKVLEEFSPAVTTADIALETQLEKNCIAGRPGGNPSAAEQHHRKRHQIQP